MQILPTIKKEINPTTLREIYNGSKEKQDCSYNENSSTLNHTKALSLQSSLECPVMSLKKRTYEPPIVIGRVVVVEDAWIPVVLYCGVVQVQELLVVC